MISSLFQRIARITPVFLVALALFGVPAYAQELGVSSPDGHIQALFNPDASYRVLWNKRLVLLPSPFGIGVDGQNLARQLTLTPGASRTFKETYPVMGVHSSALTLYNETIFAARGGANQTPWQLEVRVFNDGVALRYRVPGTGPRHLDGETTGWQLPAGSVTWAQSSTDSYERPYLEQPLQYLAPDTTIAAPLVAKLPGGGYAFVSEANVVNYSDMALRVGTGGAVSAQFVQNPDGWTTQGEIVSPWRITVLARDLTALVNTDMLRNLCPPPAPELRNATWIEPGRSTWHWLVTGRPKVEQQPQWMDWTQQLGFDYYLVDDGWRDWNGGGQNAWDALKGVVDYARPKNVKIWAWVHSREVFKPQERIAYFQKARDIGLAGLKIDFPGRPNVEWINWYDETLRDAANAQLMIDFHGSVKPSGRDRTWPNELTREAVLGRESGKLPALHDTSLPFTRYVQGNTDFTPTDFRPGRLRDGSWAHELAQAIVYTSPFLCYGGSPENYLGNPALPVLKAIPPTWDETIVLPDSEIGRTAAFARRKGGDWFVGIINGNDERPFRVALSFLGPGRYNAAIFADDGERNDAWKPSQRVVTKGDSLPVALRRDGGFVARFTKINSQP